MKFPSTSLYLSDKQLEEAAGSSSLFNDESAEQPYSPASPILLRWSTEAYQEHKSSSYTFLEDLTDEFSFTLPDRAVPKIVFGALAVLLALAAGASVARRARDEAPNISLAGTGLEAVAGEGTIRGVASGRVKSSSSGTEESRNKARERNPGRK